MRPGEDLIRQTLGVDQFLVLMRYDRLTSILPGLFAAREALERPRGLPLSEAETAALKQIAKAIDTLYTEKEYLLSQLYDLLKIDPNIDYLDYLPGEEADVDE